MKLDSTAAAYGLVQVVFADATDRLATAVFVLTQRRDTSVTFGQIYRQEFKRLLQAFKDEIKQFDGQAPVADDQRAIREACQELRTLSVWRNDRIHARVYQAEDGLALYDWRTRKRLSMSYEECEAIIQRLANVIVILEAHLPSLVTSLDFDKAWSDFFAGLETARETESE